VKPTAETAATTRDVLQDAARRMTGHGVLDSWADSGVEALAAGARWWRELGPRVPD
jgi:hypothetical protein